MSVETSVIIPTYNRAHFLRQAIESVLAQTVDDFELIVVDDGSTDDTASLVAEFGQKVIYARQEHRGVSAARNRGIELAKGEFLTFLDSDDQWRPGKLQAQLALMRANSEAIVCYTDEIWIRRGVRVNQRRKHRKYSGWIFAHCLPLCIVSPSSVLMRRHFFDEVGVFDEELPACEDYDMWLRASLRFPFHFISEPLIVKYGGHAGQLSSAWGLDRYRVQALQKVLSLDLSETQVVMVQEEIARKCRVLINGFRKRGREPEARKFETLARSVQSARAASGQATT